MGRRNKGPKDVFELMQQREGYRMTRGFYDMNPAFEEDDELPADFELELYEIDPILDDDILPDAEDLPQGTTK